MRKRALYYYEQGYNCSQCLLKAAEEKYAIDIPSQMYKACSCINTGFGVGGICSVIVAATMIFGIIFDEAAAKSMRMQLLDRISDEYQSINCSQLMKYRGSGYCQKVIGDIAEITDLLIQKRL